MFVPSKTDNLYFIIVGKYDVMAKLIELLNNKKYLLIKINHPMANISVQMTEKINNISKINVMDSLLHKQVIIDDGAEYAQCHICAVYDTCNDYYMLQMLIDEETSYLLTYVKFKLAENDNPEQLIHDWFAQNIKKIPCDIKKNTKLITLTGINANILVISTEIRNI